MIFSFRSKLFLSYTFLALLMTCLFYGYSNQFLNKRLVDENRELLLSEARIVRLQIEDLPAGYSLQRLTERLGLAMHARITLVAPDGRVLTDSDMRPELVGTMENHLARPEIQEALSGKYGSAVRYSETLRTSMLYVAVPYRGSVGEGLVRLALPLASLEKAKASLHLGLSAVASGVLILALLFSAIFSGFISRPLRAMADASARFGAGDWTLRVPVTGVDEGAYLGRVLNQMADRIEQQMIRLKEERQQLDTILQSMGEGVIVLDPAGRILLANPAFKSHFGPQDGELGSRLVEVSRNPDLLALYQSHRESGNEVSSELTLRHANITFATHWVSLGNQEGTVAVFHDISDLKRLEAVRRDFVANVSHELRTPITVIKGFAETLLDGVLENDQVTASRFVATIRSHADRMATLIEDLLSLSELEAAGYRLEMGRVDLAECAKKICSLLEAKIAAKNIQISNELSNSQLFVKGNQQRLEQVFFNLVDNALTYTPSGGSVTLFGEADSSIVTIRIVDTGPGIPPEHLPRIFERFYRVDPSRSREQGGTGLGLAIVKHIVQLHGSTVGVKSTPGVGSTFYFTLPIAPQ